jgi:hypothetical protein
VVRRRYTGGEKCEKSNGSDERRDSAFNESTLKRFRLSEKLEEDTA